MTKSELRKYHLSQRQALTLSEIHGMTARMLDRLQALPVDGIRYLMSYKPMAKWNEPMMHFFEEAILLDHPEVGVAYPVIDPADGSMKAMLVDDDTTWEEKAFGVQEPVNGAVLDPQQLDLVFVPLIIFDRQGFRVGFGKGYYDRFLARCRKDTITIGLSYFEPVDRIEDTHQFDIPLKYCVTPQHLYEF